VRVLSDVLDVMSPRHLMCILLQDMELYTKLHMLLDQVQNINTATKEEVSAGEPIRGVEAVRARSAGEVIGQSDEGLYENEQLRGINKYYFAPFLSEGVPYSDRYGAKKGAEARQVQL
jgi:hypothetical protein